MNRITEMLNPQSVALIGATEKESSIGRAVLTNLLGAGKRPLYPINPNRKSVLGLPCFPSIGDVPERVSLAVIVTPARTVPRVVNECGVAGVAGAIILSAGFGEGDPDGKELRKEIIDLHKKHGLRIIGPNCLGVILPHFGLNATCLESNPRPGRIALVSQAPGDAILDWGGAMGIGFSMFASLGSMIDVGYGELIDFLHDDYNTKSMMICMENVGDARRFISAARSFALSKPLVVLKPGRSKTGSRFIAERTEGVIGDDRVYDAVFKRVGAVRVRELSDLFSLAEVLDSRYLPRGPRLAVITNAGDVGIMAVDTLAEFGGNLASIPHGNMGSSDLFLPEQWSRDEPIDMTGGADTRRYVNTVKTCLGNEGVDGILVIYTPRAAGAIDLAQALIEISQKTAKPVIVTCIGGERAAADRRILLQNDVPAYATPEEAVRTYPEGAWIYPTLKDSEAGQQVLTRLEEVLVGFSNLVVDFAEIESVELVLWVRESDLLAGDVKIVPSRNYDDSTPYPHLVITPYPLRYITTWNLPDGTEVLLRPVRPEDEPMVRETVATLSEETLRTRFFTPLEITHDLLIRSCNIDYDREIAIVAEIKKDGKKRMIGGSRLISEPDTRRAQFAILVHDDYQRIGLGAKLIDILIGIAQEKKLDEIYGLVLSENRKMLALCGKLGFEIKLEPDGISRVSLPLQA